jgi:hypothetical protein
LLDISTTVARLMGFEFSQSRGKVLKELFPAKTVKQLGI